MGNFLTRVHLHYGRDRFNYYIRFGTPTYRDDYAAREAFEYYATGAIFGYIRWKTNDYGTRSWQLFILQAGDENIHACNIPGVTPGAVVLANISGKARVHRLFKAIDRIEADDIDLCDVAPWYWIQTNARINTRLEARAYTQEQHRVWLLEKAVSS